MKSSDFSMRTGFIESFLVGSGLIGAEVGVDAGAHAESLLFHCDIKTLYLIDPWGDDLVKGYCRGRLETKGWKHRIKIISKGSKMASYEVTDAELDFVYFDQEHHYEIVKEDLNIWNKKLHARGIIAVRNYAPSNEGLKGAVDEFLLQHPEYKHQVNNYHNEIVIWKM